MPLLLGLPLRERPARLGELLGLPLRGEALRSLPKTLFIRPPYFGLLLEGEPGVLLRETRLLDTLEPPGPRLLEGEPGLRLRETELLETLEPPGPLLLEGDPP